MRVRVWSAIAFAVVGNVAVAYAADKPDDLKENRVEARLSSDARLKGQDIHVDVDEGVARIRGKVATAADKARAEQLAAKVVGVRSVDNQLEVDPAVAKDRIEHNADKAKERIDDNAKKSKDRIDENAKKAKDRTDERAKAAKESADRTNRPAAENGAAPVEHRTKDDAGDQLSDSWITGKVKAQFVGVDVLKGSDMTVDTSSDGAVTLTGTVPNETARTRAIEIARTTRGVRKVVDNLKVK
jgi:osmotically-inducible protein OsmY